jgi:hypothetical protein
VETVMKCREAKNIYFREFGGAMLLYLAVLFVAVWSARGMPHGLTRTLVLLTPMIPVGLIVWAVARSLPRMDEFMRRQSLENFAIAAAVTAGWTFTYGFLEIAGFPRLSMLMVWPVMGFVWAGLGCARMLSSR